MGWKGRGRVRFASCQHFGRRFYHLLGVCSVQRGHRVRCASYPVGGGLSLYCTCVSQVLISAEWCPAYCLLGIR